MITMIISLKTIMLMLASISIYMSINLWCVSFINSKLDYKISHDTVFPFIDVGIHKLKYIFIGIFLLFKYNEVLKKYTYEYNRKRLIFLNDFKLIYYGESYDLERSNLEKDIHKYEMYKKMKKLNRKRILNIKT